MASRYQIGTEEPRQCLGSRAASSNSLEEATLECCEYSRYRHIKKAWLRDVKADGKLGEVIVTFVKGRRV